MVKATTFEIHHIDGMVDIEKWIVALPATYTPEDIQSLRHAIQMIHHTMPESLAQALSVAAILAELRLGVTALIAGLSLQAFQEKKITAASITEKLGTPVLKLLEGVKKMEAISALHVSHFEHQNNEDQIDKLRKMLLAMVEDTRVVLIKLAEHLYFLRQAKHLSPELRQNIARQTRDIYAPLSNRLGIGKIKWEIEDLAFRYLEPEAYKTIAHLLDERRLDREKYIEEVISTLKSALIEDQIEAEVNGRVKHIYSIWRKMHRKQVDYEEIYDVRALRIIVQKERDCYAALGTVHRLWQHIPKEFDDYIATPKENGYRSLHTAVVGPQGKTVEVQIRTLDMHVDSELGVAAHWRYKEGVQADPQYEKKISWLRQLVDWQEEVATAEDLVGELRTKVLEERVYILTPKGEVIDLPQGATPLDFAYTVHTEIGHRCRGAKVNGRMVPLTYPLHTGDQVEIMTGKQLLPSRDWLNPDAGYLVTSRARAKVQSWFKKENRDDNIRAGRMILDKEWRRMGLTPVDLDKLALKLNLHHGADLLAALGAGDVRVSQLTHAMTENSEKEASTSQEFISQVIKKPTAHRTGDVNIAGVDNLLSHTAGCCKPVPGDKVIGYVTQNMGVSIHRIDCNNVLQIQEYKPQRFIEVTWNTQTDKSYAVDLRIFAQDRPGLLRDVTAILTQERVNITGLNAVTNVKDTSYTIECTIEINSVSHLGRLIEKLSAIPYVNDVVRIT